MTRRIRVNISLGEQLVKRLSAAAEARGMTRSGFIAQAVRVSLGERPSPNDFEGATRKLQVGRVADAGPQDQRQHRAGSSTFSRRMADLDGQVYEGVRRAADSVSAAMTRRRDAAKSTAADEPSAPSQPKTN